MDRSDDDDETPLVNRRLTPYQLNFQYQEQGKVKQALVKAVLCERCARKLTYKKDKERERKAQEQEAPTETGAVAEEKALLARHSDSGRAREASPERTSRIERVAELRDGAKRHDNFRDR